jgi:hypothetical protein
VVVDGTSGRVVTWLLRGRMARGESEEVPTSKRKRTKPTIYVSSSTPDRFVEEGDPQLGRGYRPKLRWLKHPPKKKRRRRGKGRDLMDVAYRGGVPTLGKRR